MQHIHEQDTLYHDECPRCKLNSVSPLLLEACEEALRRLEMPIDMFAMAMEHTTGERKHDDCIRLLESAIKSAKGL